LFKSEVDYYIDAITDTGFARISFPNGFCQYRFWVENTRNEIKECMAHFSYWYLYCWFVYNL